MTVCQILQHCVKPEASPNLMLPFVNPHCLQDMVLFNDSIYYNIAYGNLSATREQVEAAAAAAQVRLVAASCAVPCIAAAAAAVTTVAGISVTAPATARAAKTSVLCQALLSLLARQCLTDATSCSQETVAAVTARGM
jgi:hypothetical protein